MLLPAATVLRVPQFHRGYTRWADLVDLVIEVDALAVDDAHRRLAGIVGTGVIRIRRAGRGADGHHRLAGVADAVAGRHAHLEWSAAGRRPVAQAGGARVDADRRPLVRTGCLVFEANAAHFEV